MYIPFQQVFTGSLIASAFVKKPGSEISSGELLDYCTQSCVDEDLRVRGGREARAICDCHGPITDAVLGLPQQHCTKPILLKKSTCYHVRHT